MNGYPVEKIAIPPNYVGEKNGQIALIHSEDVCEWAIKAMANKMEEFWNNWDSTHLAGDEPIKLFGRYYAGTRMERSFILQMVVDLVIALIITGLYLYFKETSFWAISYLVAKMVVFVNIFYILFMIGYRMVRIAKSKGIFDDADRI
jgi:hypothetical protein